MLRGCPLALYPPALTASVSARVAFKPAYTFAAAPSRSACDAVEIWRLTAVCTHSAMSLCTLPTSSRQVLIDAGSSAAVNPLSASPNAFC